MPIKAYIPGIDVHHETRFAYSRLHYGILLCNTRYYVILSLLDRQIKHLDIFYCQTTLYAFYFVVGKEKCFAQNFYVYLPGIHKHMFKKGAPPDNLGILYLFYARASIVSTLNKF